MGEWGVRRLGSPGAELRKWRTRRGLTLRTLASEVNCDFGYLGKIENGKARLTRQMARACDQALDAGGALIRSWQTAQGRIRPAQLPAAPVNLAGRESELAALTRAMRESSPRVPVVVAIDGPAGVGKTALALRWAHQVADQFIDGQLYADLHGFAPAGRSVTVDTVVKGFLAAMGASSIPDTTADRVALYRSLLAEREVLVVLDNVRDADDVSWLVPASPGCVVVATSRRTLSRLEIGTAATRIIVRPLSERDSVSLVCGFIGEERAAADMRTVAALTRLCGHLPIALCIAAEKIATYPNRPLADLVDELLENPYSLQAWENTDLPLILSWSYHHLEPDVARLFRLLGLYRGPHLSVAAIAALTGMTVLHTRQLLHALASLQLIDVRSDQQIGLHNLTRAYARDLALSCDAYEQRRTAVQRLVSWYVKTAYAARQHLSSHLPDFPDSAVETVDGTTPLTFTDGVAASAWCVAERDNLGPITVLAQQYRLHGAVHSCSAVFADVILSDQIPRARTPGGSTSTTLTKSNDGRSGW